MYKTYLKNKGTEKIFSIFALFFYIAISSIKMWDFLSSGRIWAEEGTIFYPNIVDRNIFDGVFFVYNGHIELITNIIVYISTLAELKYTPILTTYLSFIAQTIPIYLIIHYRKSIGLPGINVIALIIIAAGVPQAAEVWSNSINLHFHFAFLAELIAIIEIGENPQKYFLRFLLFLSGMSGIPANFLLPVYFYIATSTQNKERWIQSGILTLTALIQISVMYFSNFNIGERNFDLNPLYFWLPILGQIIIAPLFNNNYGELLCYVLADTVYGGVAGIFLSIFCSIPLLVVSIYTIKENSLKFKVLLMSAVILIFFSIFTAIDKHDTLISTYSGGRYFYAPVLILILYLLIYIKSPKIYSLKFFIFSLLVISSLMNISFNFTGPNWSESYSKSIANKSYTVDIWPNGWKMKMISK